MSSVSFHGVSFLGIHLKHHKCDTDHPWMKDDGASDKPIDIAVLTRMKQFRAMNKLKKVALKVKVSTSIASCH